MILIGDSGSTKTSWITINDQYSVESEFTTAGLNPNTISTEEISGIISSDSDLQEHKQKVTKLFFYGAGCGSEKNAAAMHQVFSVHFPSASIEIKSDLFASAYAASGFKAGIVCILGTGSNACFYDGEQLKSTGYSLGYMLGDEGSGFALGKRLLRDYFYGLLPEELQNSFAKEYQLSRQDLLQHLYHKPSPNQFVASFTPFIRNNIDHPYCNYLVNYNFDEFLKIFVTSINNYKLWPAHFTGSVAFYFQDKLINNCKANDIIPGRILREPIRELAEYHIMLEKS